MGNVVQRLSNRRGDFRVSNGNKPSQEPDDDDELPQANGQNGILLRLLSTSIPIQTNMARIRFLVWYLLEVLCTRSATF